MTRDDILKMPAGREMDALIWMALHEQNPDLTLCRFVDGDYQPNAGYPVGHISPPNYSTDIAAAWEVVDCLKSKCGEIAVGYTSDDKQWGCDIWYMHENQHGHSIGGFADTAPLAICRAALIATMNL